MNYYLLDAMQVSFLMLYSIEGKNPTFNDVKINILEYSFLINNKKMKHHNIHQELTSQKNYITQLDDPILMD